MNKKLIVIEGFDRCGKDTLMNDLKNTLKDENIYLYFNDLEGLPKYDKEQDKFLDWLNVFINKQVNDLNELFKKYDTIIMCRLLVSDEVYSNLFNREHTTIKYIHNLENIDISHYCLLFKNFDEYITRLKKIGDENIQYNYDDFVKINQLYIDVLENSHYPYSIQYIYSYTSKRSILENFIQVYNIK